MALFSKDQPPPKQPPVVMPKSEPQSGPSVTYFGPNMVIDGTVSGSEPVLIEGTVRG